MGISFSNIDFSKKYEFGIEPRYDVAYPQHKSSEAPYSP